MIILSGITVIFYRVRVIIKSIWCRCVSLLDMMQAQGPSSLDVVVMLFRDTWQSQIRQYDRSSELRRRVDSLDAPMCYRSLVWQYYCQNAQWTNYCLNLQSAFCFRPSPESRVWSTLAYCSSLSQNTRCVKTTLKINGSVPLNRNASGTNNCPYTDAHTQTQNTKQMSKANDELIVQLSIV